MKQTSLYLKQYGRLIYVMRRKNGRAFPATGIIFTSEKDAFAFLQKLERGIVPNAF